MTRKLHNTLMAVITSSSLLVVGLIASTPVTSDLDSNNTASILASLDKQADTDANGIDGAGQAPIQRTRPVRHGRQASLAMPFFSFAPRS